MLLDLVVKKQEARKLKESKQKTPNPVGTSSDDQNAPQKKKQRKNTKGSDGKLVEPGSPYKGSQ